MAILHTRRSLMRFTARAALWLPLLPLFPQPLRAGENRETAFRYTQERGVSVFYWLDGKFGYALSGEVDKAELLRIAKVVYQQLNPLD